MVALTVGEIQAIYMSGDFMVSDDHSTERLRGVDSHLVRVRGQLELVAQQVSGRDADVAAMGLVREAEGALDAVPEVDQNLE